MDITAELEILLRLLLAAGSGAAIGYERGIHGRAAGLRTHMLISLGAAVTAMAGQFMTSSGYGDPSRLASGVVSGIGFLGAGIILVKGSNKITGLTTAAAMWATAIVGIAYGAGEYFLAVSASLLIVAILSILVKVETTQKRDYLFYIEIEDAYKTNDIFKEIKTRYPNSHSSDILPAKSGLPSHVGLSINIYDAGEDKGVSVIDYIRSIPGVVYIVKE